MSTSGPISATFIETRKIAAQSATVEHDATANDEAVNKRVLDAAIAGVGGGVGPQPNSFFVASTGDDTNTGTTPSVPFLTIERALTAAIAAGGENMIELLPSRSYAPDNSSGPLTVPMNTVIRSHGHDVTILTPTTAGQALFSAAGGTHFYGFKIVGPVTVGIESNAANDQDVHLHKVRFENCGDAIQHAQTGGSSRGRLEAAWCEFFTCTRAIACSNQALVSLRDSYFDGCTDTVVPTDDTCRVNVQTCSIRNGTRGITTRGNMSVRTTTVRDCATSYTVTGAAADIDLIGSTSERATIRDLDITATSGFLRISGGLLISTVGLRIRNPNNITLLGYFSQDFPGDRATRVIGELQVGAYFAPSETALGEGDSHTEDMVVFTTDSGGTFTDRSVDAATATGSILPVFDDLLPGAAIYIGGEVPFTGIKTATTTAIDYGASGEIQWDYGVNTNPVTAAAAPNTWTALAALANNDEQLPFHLCVRNADPPYEVRVAPGTGANPRREDIFGTVESDQVRFGSMKFWERTTVNGVEKYWFRVRITTALTTAPQVEQIKLGTNRFEVNSDGFVETFGTAREYRSLDWSVTQFQRSTVLGNPSNQTVSLTDNISVGLIDNVFRGGQRDGAGFNSFTPENIDTSLPILVRVTFRVAGATAGGEKVRMPLYYKNLRSNESVLLTTGLPTTGDFVAYPLEADADKVGDTFTTYTLPALAAGAPISFDYLIDTSQMQFSAAVLSEVDQLWVSLVREGNDATDTLAQNVIIFGLQGLYPSCQSGNYLSTLDSFYQ